MNKETFFRLLGTISSLLAMIAMIPYTLGDVALIFPPEWKPVILKASLVAYAIGRILAMTFKVPFDAKPPGDDAAKPGSGSRVKLVLLFLLVPFLGGCAATLDVATPWGKLGVGSDGRSVNVGFSPAFSK